MYRLTKDGLFINDTISHVRETLVQIERSHAMLYQPDGIPAETVGVVVMHSDQNYMALSMGPQLAARGYTTIACESKEGGEIDKKFGIVNHAVKLLRSLPGIEKVVLMGHSGGATLMTAYQAIAENGPQIFQTDTMIYKCTVTDTLTPADGIMLIDSNYGNGPMMVLSLDPGVRQEGCAMDRDEAYNLFDPANGYDPKGAHYPEDFVHSFQKAQSARNGRLIEAALARLQEIEKGKGNFSDDEPFIVACGDQQKPNNRLLPEDMSFLSHTKKEHDLLHADGTVTREVIYSVRTPEFGPFFFKLYNGYNFGANKTTVRGFLSSQAIRTTEDFHIGEDGVYGVDFNSSYASPIGNVQYIHVPLLIIGLTGSYEYLAAEMIAEKAASENQTLLFLHGATHMFHPNHDAEKTPGEFGDTEKALYDRMAQWMSDVKEAL